MKKYRIYVRGENFLIYSDGKFDRFGFYTNRYIKSQNVVDATEKALQLIKDELSEYVQNEKKDPPMLYIEETTELESFGDVKFPGSGFTWYPDEIE